MARQLHKCHLENCGTSNLPIENLDEAPRHHRGLDGPIIQISTFREMLLWQQGGVTRVSSLDSHFIAILVCVVC